jgi:thiamine pyrophosphate-dependent acetolactate synthase large subunit-like protein
MDITHILLNNDELGKISKEQRAGNWKVWQTSLRNPNFAEYADNCGGLGIRVVHPHELEEALRRAIGHQGPALVEVITDPELV